MHDKAPVSRGRLHLFQYIDISCTIRLEYPHGFRHRQSHDDEGQTEIPCECLVAGGIGGDCGACPSARGGIGDGSHAGLDGAVGTSSRYGAGNCLPDTLILLLGVGILAGILGTASAWLVAAHDFPGRGILEWALLLPLAMPTYIMAYAYLDILHPLGPVQGAVRWLLGYSSPREFRLPDIRSMTDASCCSASCSIRMSIFPCAPCS